jgi:hypothetical protein
MPQFEVLPLEVLRKSTKNFSYDCPSADVYLSPGPQEYEAGVPTTRARPSGVNVLELLEDSVY